MKALKTAEFNDFIQQEGLIVLDFWANWCGPCKMLAPVMEALEQRFPQVTFAKVNVDEEPELAGAFRVDAIPCLFFVKDQQVVSRMAGFQQEDALAGAIEELMK